MKTHAVVLIALAAAACGGGEPSGDSAQSASEAPAAAQPAAAPAATQAMGEMTRPDWFTMDEAAHTVKIHLTAGATPDKNYWNYNGYADGKAAITVPEGSTVTIELENKDPVMAHSAGISSMEEHTKPLPEPTPVFAGAITPNAGSMTESTPPGSSDSFTFVADKAGNYVVMCYIPGHAATGMWLHFNVSSDGSAGVQTAM